MGQRYQVGKLRNMDEQVHMTRPKKPRAVPSYPIRSRLWRLRLAGIAEVRRCRDWLWSQCDMPANRDGR